MDKKAQAVEIFGIIIVAGLLVLGYASTKQVLSENRYVGDASTHTYYDLSRCIAKIPQDSVVYYERKQQFVEEGYKPAPCNGWPWDINSTKV